MKPASFALTFHDYAAVAARGARVQCNRATLHLARNADGSKTFVMQGPSGTHTLQEHSTDLARLNAHWTAFAAHAANAI